MHRFMILLAGAALVGGCVAPRVDTRTLLDEMTNLEQLACYPQPEFKCRQFSSYDPASRRPDDPATWFANADADHYLRVEQRDGRNEYVMLDADGPGAIVRIWSANPKGTLRIYIDEQPEPVIEAPMADLLSGKAAGIPAPIAHEVSRGWNCYLPIPYARHCKVTSDRRGFYYHVDYRTYPPGTLVRSFRPGDLERYGRQIERVAARLADPQQAHHPAARWLAQALADSQTDMWTVLPSGAGYDWQTPQAGPGAIVALHAAVDAADLESALRQLVLYMSFDGEQTVACPLGDFFGAAPGINSYRSLPMTVEADGDMWSFWVMPFGRRAAMSIENRGDQLVSLQFHAAVVPWNWDERSLHFCAKWRAEFDVPTRPMRDWNYLTARGRGVLVGAAFHIANPVGNWWGEGDEKIYVDGESFPSFFGTGTEDYYGYAWCCNVPFEHAYHNQPRCDGPHNYGHTAVNRWHVLDKIPFERELRFDMELWHWNDDTTVDMSVVSYWYARPGASDEFPPIAPQQLRVTRIPPYQAPRVAGALEGEELEVVGHTGGELHHQPWYGLSNEKHLWWINAKPHDRLVLVFAAPAQGRYRVLARFLTAGDYGIHQLYVNGQPAGEPIDLYYDAVKPSEEYDLGTFELTAAGNELAVEIVGANEKAIEKYMFGLDYLRLEAVAPEPAESQPAQSQPAESQPAQSQPAESRPAGQA